MVFSNPYYSRIAWHHVVALLLAFFSFFMSWSISKHVFEQLPHLEDEVAYLWEAKLLARGQSVIESPSPRRAYWQPFVVDHINGLRFGKYTLGWPLLLAPGVAMGQPWLINAFFSALTVALVYRMGREIFNPDAGVVAAALTAFSPIALLLNGTLMGHTAALFTTCLFMYAYWRMSRPAKENTSAAVERTRLVWGAVAGLALGWTVINRPLAGLAVAAPFVIWSGIRLLRAFLSSRSPKPVKQSPMTASQPDDAIISDSSPGNQQPALAHSSLPLNAQSSVARVFLPLLILAVITGMIALIIPAFNHAASGEAGLNLYTLVWPYDKVGFGEGYGRNGHTLEKGIRQTRWDLSLTAADLFGWQFGGWQGNDITPALRDHLLFDGDYWEPIGLSWILLPFGLLLAWRRRSLIFALWLLVGAVVLMLTTNLDVELLRDRNFAYGWMAGAALWVCLPFAFLLVGKWNAAAEWVYLMLAIALALVGLHFAYWIGSQRYSTRYYFEMLAPLALISAVPVAWLARRLGRLPVYLLLALALGNSFFLYSLPRIEVLYRFNWVSPEMIEAVEARREDDRPVLVLLEGADIRWRALGPLMAITSPHLDSDIVAGIDNTQPGFRAQVLARFPDRQIIEMTAQGNRACFADEPDVCFGEPIPTS